MKIIDILSQDKVTLSFEVFPPKTSDSYESVAKATQEIAALKPDFMSVTYGAGGGTSDYTVGIAAGIRDKYGVEPLAHLTCASSTREHVHQVLGKLKESGISNVLALRGDIPEGGAPAHDYHHAAELVREIKASGDFCVGGACYPEGHPESPTKASDIDYLKAKVEAGCEFLTTQMFFDNNILYNFLYLPGEGHHRPRGGGHHAGNQRQADGPYLQAVRHLSARKIQGYCGQVRGQPGRHAPSRCGLRRRTDH